MKELSNLNVDWIKCFEFASSHRLLANLYHAIIQSELNPLLPIKVNQELELIYLINKDRNEKIVKQTKQIISKLNAHGISPLLLKGASYLFHPTTDLHTSRMVSDIDLLIKESQIQRSVEILHQDGYEFMNLLENECQHLDALYKPDFITRVEIHHQPLSTTHCDLILNAHNAWQHAEPILENNLSYYLLCPEHRIIQQCCHAQIQNRDHVNLRLDLRQLYDMAIMYDAFMPTLNTKEINRIFDNADCSSTWHVYLIMANYFFPSVNFPTIKSSSYQRTLAKITIQAVLGKKRIYLPFTILKYLTRPLRRLIRDSNLEHVVMNVLKS